MGLHTKLCVSNEVLVYNHVMLISDKGTHILRYTRGIIILINITLHGIRNKINLIEIRLQEIYSQVASILK